MVKQQAELVMMQIQMIIVITLEQVVESGWYRQLALHYSEQLQLVGHGRHYEKYA